MSQPANTTSSIIPCLRYRNALAMIDWLCEAFGFEKHAVYADGDTVHHAQLAESINPGNATAMATMSSLGSSGLSADQVLAQINRLVDQQAYMLAANDVFYVSALIFLLLIPLVYLTRHTKAGAGSADAAAGAH